MSKVDIETQSPLHPNYMFSRWAANAQEVLIRGSVPWEAIIGGR